jgi:hypothetical protein
MSSVVGMGTGVAMVTFTVVGIGVDNGVRAGVDCVVAGVFVPELVVQPEENMHSRIARLMIRILICFMSRGLLLIHISDLCLYAVEGSMKTRL